MAVCLICEDQDAMHRYVCYGCTNRMRRQLRELETYAAILAVTVAPLHGGSGRRAPGYDSRSPARDDVIVMLDWRTRTDSCGDDDDDSPIWSLLGTLHGLSIYIAGQLGHTEPMRITMTVVTAYLLAVVDRCALEKWVVDVAADIHDLHTQARALAHDCPPRPLGACLGVGCGGAVYPAILRDQRGEHEGARCSRCLRAYDGLDLARLGAQEVTAR